MYAQKLILIYVLEFSRSFHLPIGEHMAIPRRVFPTAPLSLGGSTGKNSHVC